MLSDQAFVHWLAALERRHLASLTFPEVSRALRALSSAYVERRGKIADGSALSGAGKRAAFALFYAPLHFLIVEHIVDALKLSRQRASTLVDLGCGTGAAGAAWANHCPMIQRVIGVDRHPWVLGEAQQTYRAFGVSAEMRQLDIARAIFTTERAAFVAAFTLNEMDDIPRDALLGRLVQRGENGDSVLVVEPLAGFVAPWWGKWRNRFVDAGGRADEWRLRTELPPIVAKLDKAAGLDHREITARSLWITGRSG